LLKSLKKLCIAHDNTCFFKIPNKNSLEKIHKNDEAKEYKGDKVEA